MIPKFEMVRRDALDFLKGNRTAVVATTVDNDAYASTVYYVVDDDFTFYFVTQSSTNKYLNMSRNSKAAIVVGTGPEHISVNARGVCEPVFDDEATAVFERVFSAMSHDRVRKWPIRDMVKYRFSHMRVFKVIPTSLTFMNLDDENYSASVSNRYVTIIP